MRGQKQIRGRDEVIASLAGRQHGVVARRQLLALGIGSGAIDRAVASGRLHPLQPGVYAVGHVVISVHGHWIAAVLTGPRGAVLSHRSAAALWGIRENRGGPIHISSTSKSRSRGIIRRHHARLPADEITVEDEIPVTTPPRTILDLAAADPTSAEPALRQAEYLRLTDTLSLWDLLDRHPRHRGARAIRVALSRLGETPGVTRSALEERFLPFLDSHSLPRPHLNSWLSVGAERFQVDCLWPERRLVVELDGYSAHGTRSAFRADKTRDRRIAAAGYRIVRITWAALADEPEAIAADLRRLLRGTCS